MKFQEKVVRDLYWVLTSENLVTREIERCKALTPAHLFLENPETITLSDQRGTFPQDNDATVEMGFGEDEQSVLYARAMALLHAWDADPRPVFAFLRARNPNTSSLQTLGHYFASLIEVWLHLGLSTVLRGTVDPCERVKEPRGDVAFDEKSGACNPNSTTRGPLNDTAADTTSAADVVPQQQQQQLNPLRGDCNVINLTNLNGEEDENPPVVVVRGLQVIFLFRKTSGESLNVVFIYAIHYTVERIFSVVFLFLRFRRDCGIEGPVVGTLRRLCSFTAATRGGGTVFRAGFRRCVFYCGIL